MQNSFNKYGEGAFRFYVLERLVAPTFKELLAAEQRWIDSLKPKLNMTNLALGVVYSPEVLAKMRANHNSKNPEVAAKIAAANRGQKRSAASRARMSAAAKKRPPISEKTRAKMAEIMRLRMASPEVKERLRQSLSSRIISDETREKLRLKSLGNRFGALRKKTAHSAETRAKMSAAAKIVHLTRQRSSTGQYL